MAYIRVKRDTRGDRGIHGKLSSLADYLIKNFRYAEFDSHKLLAYCADTGRPSKSVTKSLRILTETEFLLMTGHTKSPTERQWRITYRINHPEFETYADFLKREEFDNNERIHHPQPHVTVHRLPW